LVSYVGENLARDYISNSGISGQIVELVGLDSGRRGCTGG